MTGALTVEQVSRRYLALVALRWFPTGLLIPVVMLLPLERGLTLSEIGLAAAAQGLFVLFLELPTGGLADSLGRKHVLVAASLVGEDNVNRNGGFVMASEDFSYMLEKVPGAFILIGNGGGEGGCEVHNPGYDFNDAALPLGATLWARVVETRLAKPD